MFSRPNISIWTDDNATLICLKIFDAQQSGFIITSFFFSVRVLSCKHVRKLYSVHRSSWFWVLNVWRWTRECYAKSRACRQQPKFWAECSVHNNGGIGGDHSCHRELFGHNRVLSRKKAKKKNQLLYHFAGTRWLDGWHVWNSLRNSRKLNIETFSLS